MISRNKKGNRFISNRIKRVVNHAILHINATRNNVHMTVTDLQGNTIYWRTTRCCGFLGAKRTTAYASQYTTQYVIKHIKSTFDTKIISVKFKGHFLPRDAALKSIQAFGMPVAWLQDSSSQPHGGVRPRKKRSI
ncbi:30S ribosomal protein S11 [Anaplasmataceae bacterium AB001_6]|nr:30S ribosomal protein S11 [Anaplasmataceae bacterium AB001_6]